MTRAKHEPISVETQSGDILADCNGYSTHRCLNQGCHWPTEALGGEAICLTSCIRLRSDTKQ